jgi:site-specific recombinase XerD
MSYKETFMSYFNQKSHNTLLRPLIARLEGAYAPSTIRAYYCDIQAFVDWCEENKRSPFPASSQTIVEYLEDQAATLTISTVNRRLYGIRKAYELLELSDPTTNIEVKLALRRTRREKFERSKQAEGLTKEYMSLFLAAQPQTPIGLRNKTMISLGYDLLARRSELVALKTSDLSTRRDGSMQAVIRRSKSDPYGRGRNAFCSKRSTKLVTEWLEWRGRHIEYLFCPIYQNKALDRSLSASTVKVVIKSAALLAGVDPWLVRKFSGHSMRVGAAQDLFRKGVRTSAITRAGGWKSRAILDRYLEKAEHNVWLD